MDWKSISSFVAIVVSIVSLYLSNQAREQAQALKETQFYSETTLKLLNTAFFELKNSDLTIQGIEQRQATAAFLNALSDVENSLNEHRDPDVVLVRSFIERAGSQNLLPIPKEKVVDFQSDGNRATIGDVGKWHSIISSYRNSASACVHAMNDVKEFSKLLADEELVSGKTIRVFKTLPSKIYTVGIDAGDDLSVAKKLSQLIIEKSPESIDGRTGRDSYVKENAGWEIPKDCLSSTQF